MKRFASHLLFVPESGYLKQQVVEVEEGRVVRYYPLTEEVEDTEWVPGVIQLEDDVPYQLFPFDLVTLQPVDGTRRRQLR